MDKKDIERRLEAAEKQNLGLLDEIKNLKEKLAQIQDEPEISDMPYFSSAERWWYVESEGSLVESVTIHDSKRSEFNCFHSKEMAQEFAKKCKFIAMMLHCKWYICRDYNPDFNDGISKWSVVLDYEKEKFIVGFTVGMVSPTIFFDTEENAQKCADWLNKHWKENDNE